eukprot:353082-Chlamydomonas_euryale.AAC.24
MTKSCCAAQPCTRCHARPFERVAHTWAASALPPPHRGRVHVWEHWQPPARDCHHAGALSIRGRRRSLSRGPRSVTGCIG